MRRTHPVLSAALIVLLAAVAGTVWYAYPIMNRYGASLTRLFGMEPVISALSDQMKKVDSSFTDLTARQEDLRQQVDKLGRDTHARLEAARKQTGDATSVMMDRIGAEIGGQVTALATRVSNLESSRDSEQTRIAGLQQDLNQVRTEMARQSEQLVATRRQIDGNSAATEQQLASLKESADRKRGDVDRIANSLAVERVGFEATKGHGTGLAPGISLELTGTDVAYRRASGWGWFMPDRRTIWIRQQNVQEPVVFYGLADGQKRELVITQVVKNSVAGYLILPKGAPAGPAVSSTIDSSTPNPIPTLTAP